VGRDLNTLTVNTQNDAVIYVLHFVGLVVEWVGESFLDIVLDSGHGGEYQFHLPLLLWKFRQRECEVGEHRSLIGMTTPCLFKNLGFADGERRG